MKLSLVQLTGIVFCFVISTHHCQAQSHIHGTITDSLHQPLIGASVSLQLSSDSSLVKGAVTNKTGSYDFEKIPAGRYFIRSAYAGCEDAYSHVFLVNNEPFVTLPALAVIEKPAILTDVAVITKKPLFEQQIDRMVINVANNITNTGSTALDVLMRSPGILVNLQNNTLSMNGKDGVVVMLNGKINRMPVEAIVQLLAGMSSANIEKIELITTPPANYDAEGNAGFINIILKKNTQYGTNGSVSATAGYGIQGGPLTAGSINLNSRKKWWNVFGDYSFNRLVPQSFGFFYRKVMNGTVVTENRMTTTRDDFRRTHNGRIGADFELNSKTVVGVLLTGFSNMYGMEAVNRSNIVKQGTLDTSLIIKNPERHPLDNYSINLNAQHHFKSEEKLVVNADYIFFRDANTLNYENDTYNGNGDYLFRNETKSGKETNIHLWVATADFTKTGK